MTKAIRIHRTGGPEVMQYESIHVPPPGIGEVCVRHTAIGVNFVDVNYRTGLYPLSLPAIIGNEGAGIVEEIGEGVAEFTIGDRVAYGEPVGSYCERRNIPAGRLVKLPDRITDHQAASVILKGLTASCMVHRSAPIKAGDKILIHAVTGGVSSILCQWAKHLGAMVIGTAGSEEKAQLAQEHGCDHVIFYRQANFVEEVRRIVPEGVAAVYDGVGRDTFLGSLDCIRPFGTMVAFGNASGPVTGVNVRDLSERGCLNLTRPKLRFYIGDDAALRAAANELFSLVTSGVIRPSASQKYQLFDATQAHRDLESRKTSGSILLLP
jgi:NADPH:quinone reductase-like Zn-dependent oxidoreductase